MRFASIIVNVGLHFPSLLFSSLFLRRPKRRRKWSKNNKDTWPKAAAVDPEELLSPPVSFRDGEPEEEDGYLQPESDLDLESVEGAEEEEVNEESGFFPYRPG